MSITGKKFGFILDTVILILPWLALYSFVEPLTSNNGNSRVVAYCVAILAFSLHVLVILFAILSSKIQIYIDTRIALDKMQILAMAKILNMESVVLASTEYREFMKDYNKDKKS